MKKTETYEQKINRLVAEAKSNGFVKSGSRVLIIGDDEATVEVRDADDGLVAFSCMKGDFEASVKEFVEDYIA